SDLADVLPVAGVYAKLAISAVMKLCDPAIVTEAESSFDTPVPGVTCKVPADTVSITVNVPDPKSTSVTLNVLVGANTKLVEPGTATTCFPSASEPLIRLTGASLTALTVTLKV